MIKKLYQKHKDLIFIIIASLLIYITQIIVCKIYPFGQTSLIAGDMAGQYIPFWQYLKSYFQGQESIFYSFAKGLGGNMIGIWAYYLMSPYNIIFLFFSHKLIVEAIIVVTGLKFISCSITMYIYLKNKVDNKFILAILCLSYAFCGYNVVFQMNLMWLDNIILLPLMVLGAEKVLEDNKYKMYTITLALSLLVNFYIGFATAIFTGLYFIYYSFLQKAKIKKLLMNFIKFVCYSLLGIGLASIVLIPVIFMLKSGKGVSFSIDFNTAFLSNFKVLDLIAKFLIGATNNNQLLTYGLPNIYTGLFTILLAQIYFFNKNIPIKNKIFSLIFIIGIIYSFNIKIFNLIWHGLKEPVGFPYRYSFVFSFLIIAIACHGLGQKKKQSINWKCILFVGMINIIIMMILMKNKYEFITDNMIIFSMLTIVFYSIMLILYLKLKKKKYIILITIVCILEMVANSSFSFNQLNHSNRNAYVNKINQYSEIVTEAKKYDNTFYRMEKADNFFLNDSLLFNYNGVGHSSSTFEQSQVDFMKKIGYNWYIYFPSYGYGNTLLTDSIFGIKYKLSKKENEQYFTKLKDIENYKLYKNNYSLSLGYVAKGQVGEVDLNQDPFNIQTDLLNAITNSNLEYFNDIKLKDLKMYNIQKEGNYYKGQKGESYIELIYDVSQVKEQLYFWIATPYSLDGAALKLYINEKYFDDYLGANKNGIIKIEHDGSNIIKLKLELNTDEIIQLDNFILKELNLSNFETAYNQIKEQQLEDIKFKNNQLKANIRISESENYLFTTIPYDDAWSAYVDGKQQIVEKSNGFISLKLNEGEHEINLLYTPKGFKVGVIITGISIFILFSMIFIEKINVKKKIM